jgi:hypothetical protein
MDSLTARRAPLLAVLAAVASFAFALVAAPQAHAAACTTSWIGTVGPWNNPASWDNGVPDSNDVACIQKDGTYQIDIAPEDGNVSNGIANVKELHLGAASGTQTLLVEARVADAAHHNAALGLSGGTGSASDVGVNGVIDVEGDDADHTAMLCATSPLTNHGTIKTASVADVLGGTIANANDGSVSIGADTLVPSFTCGASSLANDGGNVDVTQNRTLTIAGSYAQTGGSTSLGSNARVVVDGGTLSPSAGTGSFHMQGSSSFGSDVGNDMNVDIEGSPSEDAVVSTAAPMTNAGTINLTDLDGSHGSTLRASGGTFTNTGSLSTLSGGGGARHLGKAIANQGTGIMLIGTDTSSETGPNALQLTQSGNDFEVLAGSKLSLPSFVQTGGSSGVFGTLDDSGTATMTGGRLEGTGTLKATTFANNGGTVAPGDSPGDLTVDGDYTQGSGGTLDVEVQGPNPGTDFDVLSVTGTATLGGTLKVTTVGTQGGEFPIVQAGQVNGTFATKNFTGQTYGGRTNATSFVLVAKPVNDTKPSVSGSPVVGSALDCNIGIWTTSDPSSAFAIRWLRDGVPLAATTATRKVLFADQGHKLSCRVTATNTAGSSSATSNAVTVPKQLAIPGKFPKKTLRASKAGNVVVPVANPNLVGAGGTLVLRNTKGKVVGSAKFQIAKRSKKPVKVHLKPGAFAKLLASGPLRYRATLVLSKGAVRKTAKTPLTVNKPKP